MSLITPLDTTTSSNLPVNSSNPSALDFDAALLAALNNESPAPVDPNAAVDATQIAANTAPQDVVDFLKSTVAGFAWAGVRKIGTTTIVAALISPWEDTQFLDGNTVGGALGNLATNIGEGLRPNVAEGTWFIAIKDPVLSNPITVTYNFATKKLEFVPPLGQDGAPASSFFGLSVSGVETGIPANPNDALLFGFQNFRIGADLDGGNALGSLNAGLLVRAIPIEAIMQVVAQILKWVGQGLTSGAAATGPAAPVLALLGQLSRLGGLVLEDWKMFWGPAIRAEIALNTSDFGQSTISANASSITFADIQAGFEEFVSNSADYLRGLATNIGLIPPPEVSMDDLLLTLQIDDVPNRDLISFQTTTALDNGADAFSMLRTAWDAWDPKVNGNGPNLRENAATVYNSLDPRLAIARDFVAAFYSTGTKNADGSETPVTFIGTTPEGRAGWFERNDILFRGRDAFGDFVLRNVSANNGIFERAKQILGAEEFSARLQAFAEQMTRLGYNLNLGSSELDTALTAARTANPQLLPAENESAINSYFARTDLSKVTSSFAQADARGEAPLLALGDIPGLFLVADPNGGAPNPWARILDEVSLGRMDLFEALGAMQSYGDTSPATQAISRMRDEMKALLTAPLTNREFEIDRDNLAVPSNIAALRQQRADILAAFEQNPTFDGMIEAINARIDLEPQFAHVIQAYLQSRNITLPGADSANLFQSALPDVGLYSIANPNELLLTLPGTVVENGVTTNRYLPASFFDTSGNALVVTPEQGQRIADNIVQYDLAPGEEGTQPPVGPLFDPGSLSITIGIPGISSDPVAHNAPAGWRNTSGTPDVIVGDGPWPGGGSNVLTDIGGPSPYGGTMGMLVSEQGYKESINTTLSGLVVGQTYTTEFAWQQATLANEGKLSGGNVEVTIGDEVRILNAVGTPAGDEWKIEKITFVATSESMEFGVSSIPDRSGVIVVDTPGPNVQFRNLITGIDENATAGRAVKVADIVVDGDLANIQLSLAGADADKFQIVGDQTTGYQLLLKQGAEVDYETQQVLAVSVLADDLSTSNTPDTQGGISLGIRDVIGLQLSNTVISLWENTPVTVPLRVADIATEAPLTSLVLSGADADKFEIANGQLLLKAGTVVDYEVQQSLNVTVQSTDPAFTEASQDLQISVRDITVLDVVNQPYESTGIDENTDTSGGILVGDIIFDGDAANFTLTLTGTDADKFEIIGNQLFLKPGVIIDYEALPTGAYGPLVSGFEVTVQADDLTTPEVGDGSKTVNLRINDLDDTARVSFENVVSSFTEGLDTTQPVRVADLTILNAPDGTYTLTLAGTDADKFELLNNQLFLKAGTVLDYETQTYLDVQVQVDDLRTAATIDNSQSFGLSVEDVPAVSIINQPYANSGITENTDTSNPILIGDLVFDGAPENFTLNLTGPDADKFQIIGNQLFLKPGVVIDYEAQPVISYGALPAFNVTVEADDITTTPVPDGSQAITVNINDIAE